jgi:predicted Fe-S protein YdhL (DUF1289 family)
MTIPRLYALAGIKLLAAGEDRWKAVCPFHAEKDPSFTVYEDASYYCFGCGAYGTIKNLYDGISTVYQNFPSLTDVPEEKKEVLDRLKKRLQKKIDQELRNQNIKIKSKLYDAFDLTFLYAYLKLEDQNVDLVDIVLFTRKKCNQILQRTVNTIVKKVKFDG